MAFKTFVPGTTLTAGDVNEYLMKQSVIVCTSSTRPSSPVEGMTIYQTDTDDQWFYTGAAWRPTSGLVYITEVSTSNTVQYVDLVSCFSSRYDNYRLELSNIRASSSNVSFQMLSGSTPLTTNTYAWGFVGVSTLSASTNYSNNAQPNGLLAVGYSTTDTGGAASYDILNPFLARRTVLIGGHHNLNSGLNGFDIRSGASMNENAVSYDGLRILANAGNLTVVARLYGYRQV